MPSEYDCRIALLVNVIAADADPFPSLTSEGKELAVYSSHMLGSLFYYWGYQKRCWLDLICPQNETDELNERHTLEWLLGPLPSLKAIEAFDTKQYHVILLDDEDEKDYAYIQESQPQAKIVMIKDYLIKLYHEKMYLEPMIAFAESHPQVHVLVCNGVHVNELRGRGNGLSEHEETVENFQQRWRQHNADSNFADPVWKPRGLSVEYVTDVAQVTNAERRPKGLLMLSNRTGQYLSVVNGFRTTTGTPESYHHTIWVFGSSRIFGGGTDDARTIPSYLQQFANSKNYSFRVVNCSNYSALADEQQFRLMEQLPIADGDIVISMTAGGRMLALRNAVPTVDLRSALERPHSMGEIFWDSGHYNYIGYRALAEKIFEALEDNDMFSANVVSTTSFKMQGTGSDNRAVSSFPALASNESAALQSYVDTIAPLRQKSGAVVMNCNPFTLGHRYLIEQALHQVAHLFIFVVQDDSSHFPFEDRLRLVKEGVADLDNVTVIPSGEFIISKRTFAAYSQKEELQNETIDSSMDVYIFGTVIAPALGITTRFVGEEPFDNVTRQYNTTMQIMLPQYGIDLVIIPRQQSAGTPISASKVRELFAKGDFTTLKELVPLSTLNYLRRKGQEKGQGDGLSVLSNPLSNIFADGTVG
jgi:[citrate (pro-3S)-lyase] ligase